MKLTIYGDPRTKKNSSRIMYDARTGRRFVSASAAYKEYEDDCAAQIVRNTPEGEPPYNVKCVYYMRTRRKVDLVNLLEATCDILVRAGVLPDDDSTVIASHDGSRVRYDRDEPRVEIDIAACGGE